MRPNYEAFNIATYTPPGRVHHKGAHRNDEQHPRVSENINSLVKHQTRDIEHTLTHRVTKAPLDVAMRPQLHCILQSGPGSLKSTVFQEIAVRNNVTPYSYVTLPAMIGTIDPVSGDLISGLVWQTRKKPLLLDEFRTGERGDTGSIDVLLGVLESGLYKRKVGQRTRLFSEEDGDLYYRAQDGEIEVKTRFPCIIATMKNLDKARSEKYQALVQRGVPIQVLAGS